MYAGPINLPFTIQVPGVTRVSDLNWKPIASAPRGVYVLLRGPSGYTTTPFRYVVARHDEEFRPKQPWVDYAGDSVLDSGEMPTEFCEL